MKPTLKEIQETAATKRAQKPNKYGGFWVIAFIAAVGTIAVSALISVIFN